MTESGTCHEQRSGVSPALIAFGAVAVLALAIAVVLAVSSKEERGVAGTTGLIDLAAPPPGSSARLRSEETQALPDDRTLV